jgi:hypothetical protein
MREEMGEKIIKRMKIRKTKEKNKKIKTEANGK